jgi:hypothetical protein
MHERLQVKIFPGVIPRTITLGGRGPPGRRREGTEDEGKGGQRKGGDGGVVERRRGGEGGKGEKMGWLRARREMGEGIVAYHF